MERVELRLVRPVIYVTKEGKTWIKLQDLIDIAKQEFGMEASEVWSDICEWGKPHGGLRWIADGVVMRSESGLPDKIDEVYVLEKDARHFYNQARNGAREVKYNEEERGHRFKWAQ